MPFVLINTDDYFIIKRTKLQELKARRERKQRAERERIAHILTESKRMSDDIDRRLAEWDARPKQCC